MKKVFLIICLISFSNFFGQVLGDGNYQINANQPTLILNRNSTSTGGFSQGIQTRLQDGTNNFWFGNINSNEWYISKGSSAGSRWLTLKDGRVGIGTSDPKRLFEINVPQQINTNEVIRIGSAGTSYNGIGLNYRTDANGVPSGHLVSYLDNKTNSVLTYTTKYLAISTNAEERMRIDFSGNVGIGTMMSGAKLEIGVKNENNQDEEIRIGSRSSNKFNGIGMNYRLGATKIPSYHLVNYFAGARRTLMTFTKEGRVGIGTEDTFGYMLAVNGIIGAKEVRVEISSAWPDYVFAKDYQLPSLENLETQIKECGHLPNIPSAKQVQEEGITLGEMNAKLLEKVEELTLYTIQQDKQIKEQEARLKKLEELLLKK